MDFYTSIAEYYDKIFPGSPQQLIFLKECIETPYHNKKLLDIGCGTGTLSLSLAEIFKEVIGTDLDKEMLEIAKQKSIGKKNNICFKDLDMLETQEHFTPNSLDAVICLGNTLVHLNNNDEIKNVLLQINKTLKPGGSFVFQIINYQNILKNNINNLPLIENNGMKFERYYKYDSKKNKILFSTILSGIEDKEKIENEVLLYPVLIDDIKDILKATNFVNSKFFSNFLGEAYHEEGYHLIVKTEKLI